MNLPNKLTIFRVILIPLFCVFLLTDPEGDPHLGMVFDHIAVAVFAVASITDFFDGLIARKRKLVTNFGKFMDPLADKLLVDSAFICLLALGRIPVWVVLIIIGREFVISAFRLVAVEQGAVIAAGYWGKSKTVIQMFCVIALILHFDYAWYKIIEIVLIYASVVLCIISLIDYLYRNRKVIQSERFGE